MTWFSIIQMCNGLAPLQFSSDNIPTERKKERPLPTLWIPCCSRKNNNSSNNNNNNKKRWTSTTVCTLPRDRLRPGPEIRSARVLRPPPPPPSPTSTSISTWLEKFWIITDFVLFSLLLACCWSYVRDWRRGSRRPRPNVNEFSDSTERQSKTQLG
jgi:hypothetical protein